MHRRLPISAAPARNIDVGRRERRAGVPSGRAIFTIKSGVDTALCVGDRQRFTDNCRRAQRGVDRAHRVADVKETAAILDTGKRQPTAFRDGFDQQQEIAFDPGPVRQR